MVLMISLFTLLSTTNVAWATRKVLTVPQIQQLEPHWCWVATDKGILRRLMGSSPKQKDICYSVFGTYGDHGATQAQALQGLNNFGVAGWNYGSKLSYTAVKSQINNNHPLYVSLWYAPTATSHVNTIRGYDTSTNFILFIDPADGLYHGQTYNGYLNNAHWDGHTWSWFDTIVDAHRI